MNVCFISEHGSHIGDGHISRQYAIAEWLAEHHVAMDLYTNGLQNFFVGKFESLGTRAFVVDIRAVDVTAGMSREDQYQWCFIDGDQISDETELFIKKRFNCKTVRVSDQPIHYRHSDVLINQNYNSEHFMYEDVSGQKRFLGLKHVMLRKSIRDAVQGNPEKQKNKLVTISLGNSVGAESCAILRGLIDCFSDDAFGAFTFNIFTNNPIEAIQAERVHKNITINVPSDDFIESIKKSEFVVCSVGTTMWECMALGTPFVAIPLNDAQSEYVQVLQQGNVCMTLTPDMVLRNSLEMKKILDHYLDPKVQGAYASLYHQLLPQRFFEALEETLQIGR